MQPGKYEQMALDLGMMLGKLNQLEEQAELSVNEYPKGMGVERQRLVLALTKFLKAHVQGAVKEQERARQEDRGAGKVSN